MVAMEMNLEIQKTLEDPSKRLLRLLNTHGDRVHIDKDGLVSTDFNNPEVKAEMKRQIDLLSTIKVTKEE
ncbi:MAG: hypothetical protein RR308_11425 [Hafnia sp.]